MTSPTGSKDLQMVNIGLRVLYRPEIGGLPDLYRQLGLDYDERVLPSICNEVSHYFARQQRQAYTIGLEICCCSIQCFSTHYTTS